MNTPTTVYVVHCIRSGEPFGSYCAEEYFDRAEAEAVRDRENAKDGHYARPVEERPYKPVEHKSNFFGPPVRWDLPPVMVAGMVKATSGEHHERYYS